MDLRDITIRIEAYVNERIIEELETFTKDEFNYTYGDEYIEGVDYVQHRINQLKQER